MAGSDSRLPNDRGRRWPLLWREHVSFLALYLLLSLALAWPLARDFTTLVVSDGLDARHNLWGFWHLQQFLLGRQPLFDAPLLYYPYGISLLVHGVGPLSGLFALPFWGLGPSAAYNGALLVGLTLSGYGSYLLGRALGFTRGIAGFVGLVVLSSPTTIAGLESHITKVFVGAIPIALLILLRALDLRRSAWWAAAVGPALLLVLLHNGYQFVFTALAGAFFGLTYLWQAPAGARLALLRRGGLMLGSALLIVGPLLAAIVGASGRPGIEVDVNADSLVAPDLLQFLLPPAHSALVGDLTRQLLPPIDVPLTSIESAVSLALVGLGLLICAWCSRGAAARQWSLLTLLCVVFALGPSLRLAGQTSFTEYELPIVLPYAFLTGLPGLDFMRAPGRFMMLGFVAFAVSAGYGLAWLSARFPRRAPALLIIACALLLLETWPRPRQQEALGVVPAFYQQLANDPAQYGVFDLPLKPAASMSWSLTTIFYSSYYQTFQMTHGKGIAGGYISRSYTEHPLFSDLISDRLPPLYIDDLPAAYRNFPADLARNNYRYVVLHKTIFAQANDPVGGQQIAQQVLDVAFADQQPIVDDESVRVFQVEPPANTLQIHWGAGWRFVEEGWRWAASPASLTITAAAAQPALLEITPAFLYDPAGPGGLGNQGQLELQLGDAAPISVTLTADQTTQVPLAIQSGTQTITMRLRAGNFSPADGSSSEPISFAVRRINLRSADQIARPPDISIQAAAAAAPEQLLALYDAGWYSYEIDGQGRWSSSPATLLVYSAVPRSVELTARVSGMFDGKREIGERGIFQPRLNGLSLPQVAVDAARPLSLSLPLAAGWNRVELQLAAGSFQPSLLLPGNGDQRELSFRIQGLTISAP